MEIERKFLVKEFPFRLEALQCKKIKQGYLNFNPVVRVRQSNEDYYITCKGSGMLAREELEMPLTKDAFEHLMMKIDGNVIEKTRYLYPLENGLTAEIDIFEGVMAPLQMIEVEFASQKQADEFEKPDWFGEEVTYDKAYHNSTMAQGKQ